MVRAATEAKYVLARGKWPHRIRALPDASLLRPS
jgi:hypothetical protein